MEVTQILAAVMQLTLLANSGQSYTEAYSEAEVTGKPMLVLIGANWCPHCVTMKNSIMPQVERSGLLGQVSYVPLNSDQNPTLARQMMRGGSVPQLVLYYRTGSGWRMRHVTGGTSATNVQSMIRQALDAVATDPPSGSKTMPVSGTMPTAAVLAN